MKYFLITVSFIGILVLASCRGYNNSKPAFGSSANNDTATREAALAKETAARVAKVPDTCKKVNGTFQNGDYVLGITESHCGQIKFDMTNTSTGAVGSQTLIYDGAETGNADSSAVKRIRNKDNFEEDWTYRDTTGNITKTVKIQQGLDDQNNLAISTCTTVPNSAEKCAPGVTLSHL